MHALPEPIHAHMKCSPGFLLWVSAGELATTCTGPKVQRAGLQAQLRSTSFRYGAADRPGSCQGPCELLWNYQALHWRLLIFHCLGLQNLMLRYLSLHARFSMPRSCCVKISGNPSFSKCGPVSCCGVMRRKRFPSPIRSSSPPTQYHFPPKQPQKGVLLSFRAASGQARHAERTDVNLVANAQFQLWGFSPLLAHKLLTLPSQTGGSPCPTAACFNSRNLWNFNWYQNFNYCYILHQKRLTNTNLHFFFLCL